MVAGDLSVDSVSSDFSVPGDFSVAGDISDVGNLSVAGLSSHSKT